MLFTHTKESTALILTENGVESPSSHSCSSHSTDVRSRRLQHIQNRSCSYCRNSCDPIKMLIGGTETSGSRNVSAVGAQFHGDFV